MRGAEVIRQHLLRRWRYFLTSCVWRPPPAVFCWTWEGWRIDKHTKGCFDDCSRWMAPVCPPGVFLHLHKPNEKSEKWSVVQLHAKSCISMHVWGGGWKMNNCGTFSLAGQTAAVIMRNFMFVHLNSLRHPLELALSGFGWIVVFLITVCNKWSPNVFGYAGLQVCVCLFVLNMNIQLSFDTWYQNVCKRWKINTLNPLHF